MKTSRQFAFWIINATVWSDGIVVDNRIGSVVWPMNYYKCGTRKTVWSNALLRFCNLFAATIVPFFSGLLHFGSFCRLAAAASAGTGRKKSELYYYCCCWREKELFGWIISLPPQRAAFDRDRMWMEFPSCFPVHYIKPHYKSGSEKRALLLAFDAFSSKFDFHNNIFKQEQDVISKLEISNNTQNLL